MDMLLEASPSDQPCCPARYTETDLNSEPGGSNTTGGRVEQQELLVKSPYNPLNSDLKEIRVLEVDPGVGNDMVVCKLKHISLLDNPVPYFETISYCWGSPTVRNHVNLNGTPTSVPWSSAAALRRLRFSDKPRVLWIDAICIDQSSQSEKSEQVAFMSTIYRMGKRNLVYLGEDDTRFAERASSAVQSLISEMRTENNDLDSSVQAAYNARTGVILFSDEDFKADVDFPALERLFDLAWFR
jgi:hypothetical protein